MSKKRAAYRAQLNKAQDSTTTALVPTADAYANALTSTGITQNNATRGGYYTLDYVSHNRLLLEGMFKSSWICRRVVSTVAEDMCAKGLKISSVIDPADIERLMSSWEQLCIWDQLCETVKWSRLYGGAIAVICIAGQDMSSPLRPETISKGSFRGLIVLDRWQISPSLTDLVSDFGPDFGLPRYYETLNNGPLPAVKIHHTRVCRFSGADLPFYQRIAENGWGQSVLEVMYSNILAHDAAVQGVSQLMNQAHVRNLKVPGLRNIIAIGGKQLAGLNKSIEFLRRTQVNEGISLIDASEDMEVSTYTFSGLDSCLSAMSEQVSGAAEIPLTRLYGQSPGGLGSSGASEMEIYWDKITHDQKSKLRTPVAKILEVSYRSEFGHAPPEGFNFTFNPMKSMSDTDKATIAGTISTAIATLESNGVIDRATALKELRQSSHTTGYFSNITDEDIAAAESEPAPPIEISQDMPTGDSAIPWYRRMLSRTGSASSESK